MKEIHCCSSVISNIILSSKVFLMASLIPPTTDVHRPDMTSSAFEPLPRPMAYSASCPSYRVPPLPLPFGCKLPGSKDSVSRVPPLSVQTLSRATVSAFYLNRPHSGSRPQRVTDRVVYTSTSAVLDISAHLFL